MKQRICYLLLFGLMALSCSTTAHLPTDNQKTSYSPTRAENIEIYSTEKAAQNYIVIGEVVASADAGKDASITVNLLKKEAAALGADAIINLKLEIDYGYWTNAVKANGTAVKYQTQQ